MAARKRTLQEHVRRTMLAGLFSAIPLAITVYVFWLINEKTVVISRWLFGGREVPFAGVLIIILGIYLCGLIVNSLLGRIILGLVDAILTRVPILRDLYTAWKQISLTPGGAEGTYSKVVLVPDETRSMRVMAFTSGTPVAPGSELICVFVPGVPNPIVGKLYFVHKDSVVQTDLSAEEAFKFLLSTGNYVPPQLGQA